MTVSTAAGTAISSANPEKNTIIMMVATGREPASVTTQPFKVCPVQKVACSTRTRNVNHLLRLTAPVDEQFQGLGQKCRRDTIFN